MQRYRRIGEKNELHGALEKVRVVVDTNVLVSALIGHGKPRRLLVELLERHEVVFSIQMLAELADVLSREKFMDVKESGVDSFLSILASRTLLITVRHHFNTRYASRKIAGRIS